MYSKYVFKSNRQTLKQLFLYNTKGKGLKPTLSKYLTVNYKNGVDRLIKHQRFTFDSSVFRSMLALKAGSSS